MTLLTASNTAIQKEMKMRVTIGTTVTTAEKLISAWRTQNDNGKGYSTDSDDVEIAAGDELNDAVQIDPVGTMAGMDGDRIIVIADSNGAWACDVTDLL